MLLRNHGDQSEERPKFERLATANAIRAVLLKRTLERKTKLASQKLARCFSYYYYAKRLIVSMHVIRLSDPLSLLR